MKTPIHFIQLLLLILISNLVYTQSIDRPVILEIQEDDRVATIFWNSKTNIYDFQYDPDKQAGIYSYKIVWGPTTEGFVNSSITPYRAHMCQPLVPDVLYQAKVYAIDTLGNLSIASETVFLSIMKEELMK